MKDSLRSGLSHEGRMTVVREMLVPNVPNVSADFAAFSDMPPVFATAMMVGFIEATCVECLRGHLSDGQHRVGTHVDVSHVAATPEGMTVRALVELAPIEGRMLTFQVQVFDEHGLIGEGEHRRVVIDVERFVQKVTEKALGQVKGGLR